MKHRVLRALLFAVFRGAVTCARWVPLRCQQIGGSLLGRVMYYGLHDQRNLARRHVDMALSTTHTAAERRRIVRAMFVHLGAVVGEWLWYPRLTRAFAERWITVEGREHLDAALQRGRGVLVVSAHLGNWELLAAYFALLGYRGGVLARPFRYPEYADYFRTMRSAKGVATIDRGEAVRELVRRLRAGECIGIMPDQDVASVDQVMVEFLGRPAATPTGPAELALSTGAALVPAFIVRRGSRHAIRVHPALQVAATEDRVADVRRITQELARVTEREIRNHPDQWVWMHRRWKTRLADAQPSESGRAP